MAHALVLTILMLSSGCLGLLGDDDSEAVVKENIPIELSINGYNEFEFDQPAILSGSCNCEELMQRLSLRLPTVQFRGLLRLKLIRSRSILVFFPLERIVYESR